MRFNKQKITTILFITLLLIYIPTCVFAHKVMIFGWVEDGKIHTISKFSGGKKVQNMPVSVFDMEGKLILKGNTNEKGLFSFDSPDTGTLNVVLEAAMGHRATCIVETREKDDDKLHKSEEEKTDVVVNQSGDFEKRIEIIVEKSIEKNMAVILKKIAEKEEKQSITEIVGGIGYILGLIGIALWVKKR